MVLVYNRRHVTEDSFEISELLLYPRWKVEVIPVRICGKPGHGGDRKRIRNKDRNDKMNGMLRVMRRPGKCPFSMDIFQGSDESEIRRRGISKHLYISFEVRYIDNDGKITIPCVPQIDETIGYDRTSITLWIPSHTCIPPPPGDHDSIV